MRLRNNLLAAIVTSTAALVLTIFLLEEPVVEARELARIAESSHRLAAELEDAWQHDDPLAPLVSRLALRDGVHLQILSEDYTVLVDSALYEGHQRRVEEDGALRRSKVTGTAWERVPSEQGYAERFVFARRTPRGFVRVSQPMEALAATRSAIREVLLAGGLIAVLASFLLALALSHTIVRPIAEITEVADSLAAGVLSRRIRSDRTDELGTLGRALDGMAQQLQAQLGAYRAEEARLRAVLDGMVETVFVTDPEGRIVMANRSLESLLKGDVVGRTVVEVIRSPELHDAVRGALKGRPAAVNLEVQRAGATRSLAAQIAPLPERSGAVVVVHDVTELKRADTVRRDFVANASHELRTPLTAIRGFAETLQGGALEQPEVAGRFVDTILKHTIRLQRLVDDLITLTKAESPGALMEREPVRVHDVLTESLTHLQSAAQARQIKLTLQEPDEAVPEAWTNGWALDQVVSNLVENAIKYTQEGGEVSVYAEETADKGVAVYVSDDGPGIPSAHLARIFERFYRIDKGRSRDMGGTGLGLSIVKHLVDRMGASITVESPPGEGTTFCVTMQPVPVSVSDSNLPEADVAS